MGNRIRRDQARAYFQGKALSYEKIQEGDIEYLWMLIQREFRREIIRGDEMIPCLNLPRKKSIRMGKSGLKEAYLTMRGSYFRDREALSFNKDGFIGFAGWADQETVQPILKGFLRWCDDIAEGGDYEKRLWYLL
ncbi:MAG: hypothetical protein Q4A78_11990 [Peptostreptococcaceae bacterium]|nr:hypothetical protein [Peptostreptococcaceae bacterium]